MRILGIQLLIAASLLLAATATAQNSLYDELGGKDGISNLMADMLYEVAGDERIADQFADSDIDRVHQMLTEQVCEITGGPCTYSGDDMVKVHTGLNITQADMNALVENLIIAMERAEISVSAQNRLLSLLAAMHDEVVGL